MPEDIIKDINYAVDEEEVVETTPVEIVDVEVKEEPTQIDVADPVSEPTPEPLSKFNIEGLGEVTVEEIKEWRQGNMRQSDYTRKTQELARQRKELEQVGVAPNIPPQTQFQPNTQQPNPFMDRLVSLEQEFANRELDNMITSLKSKYSDFDEVAVLNTAWEKNLTDLEFVYKALKAEQPKDEVSLREQIKQEILKELSANKASTSTIITGEVNTQQAPVVSLTNQELIIAKNMGLTPEEYAKNKQ